MTLTHNQSLTATSGVILINNQLSNQLLASSSESIFIGNELSNQLLDFNSGIHLSATQDVPNIDNGKKNYQLHYHCDNGNIKEVMNLLAEGADVNSRNNHDLTPLHVACRYGNAEIAKLLLMHGADISLKDRDNYSALDLALNYFHNPVVNLLQDYTNINKITNLEKLEEVQQVVMNATNYYDLFGYVLSQKISNSEALGKVYEAMGFEINDKEPLNLNIYKAKLIELNPTLKQQIEEVFINLEKVSSPLADLLSSVELMNYDKQKLKNSKSLEEQNSDFLKVVDHNEALYSAPLDYLKKELGKYLVPDLDLLLEHAPVFRKSDFIKKLAIAQKAIKENGLEEAFKDIEIINNVEVNISTKYDEFLNILDLTNTSITDHQSLETFLHQHLETLLNGEYSLSFEMSDAS